MTTIKENIIQGSFILKSSNIKNSYNESLLLFSYAICLKKEQVIYNMEELIDDNIKNIFFDLIKRRANFEPIPYIVNSKEFWSIDFKVSPSTLIPRADSELVVETALKYNTLRSPKILDLGTGSGCLLLSLLTEIEDATGIGIDISKDAIKIAEYNAKNLNLSNRAQFLNINWLQIKPEHFDIIISNPPYLNKKDMNTLQKEVKYEPEIALFGGEDGILCYNQIIKIISTLPIKNPLCLFEIGYGQCEAISYMLKSNDFEIIEIKKDLNFIDRVIVFTK